MKRLFVLMQLLVFVISGWAYDVVVDGIAYNLNSKDMTAEVTSKGTKYKGNLEIPSVITRYGTKYTVIGIRQFAFSWCSELTSVAIPNTVTSIGEGAFSGCSSLTSLNIPSGLANIGREAFTYCYGLTSIDVESNNHLYDSREGCNAIIETSTNTLIVGCKNSIIPKSVKIIGDYSFKGCRGLTSVTIPSSVTNIGTWAFDGCSNLVSVKNLSLLPQNISSTTFSKYGKLHVLPGSGGDYKKASCWLNFNIIEDADLSYSDSGACGEGGDNVKWYYYEESGKLIVSGNGHMMSYLNVSSPWYGYRDSIKMIEILDGVTTIGDFAFFNCSYLKSVVIPNSIISIGEASFYACSMLRSVTIPTSVISIGNRAFLSCRSLDSVTIPNSVMDIEIEAFGNCTALSSIVVDSSNTKYDSRNGCNAIIETSSNTLISGCKNTFISNSVINLAAFAFEGCESLTSLIIPNSVMSIGNFAFAYCSNLLSMDIPNSVNAIGINAFEGCSALKSVKFGNSVTQIAYGTFIGCSNLGFVEFPNSITSIEDRAFWGCTGLNSVILGNSVKGIGKGVFQGCPHLTSVINFASTPQKISSDTFSSYGTLYVQSASMDIYRTADYWKNFNILEIVNIESLQISKENYETTVDDSVKIDVTILPAESIYKGILWTIEDEEIATVNNGVVKGLKAGTTKLTVTTTDGATHSASCQITVNKCSQTITWEQELSTCQNGGEMIALEATSSSGLPVLYSSSDPSILSIFDLGAVVYANPITSGKVVITACQSGDDKYNPAELKREINVLDRVESSTKTLVVYYSQSTLVDGIVVELARQIASSNLSTNLQKIEPSNPRINEANTSFAVRDSVMSIIHLDPNNANSYPAINTINASLGEYDNIIMVYPLWDSMMAAPMQTFSYTNRNILSKKSVAYIEYDLYGNTDTTLNAKVLRLNASNIDEKNELIEEWLNQYEVTKLSNVLNDDSHSEIYDLQGRKLPKKPTRGMYIKNRQIISR